MFVLRHFFIITLSGICLLHSGCKSPIEGVPNPNYRMGVYNLNTAQTTILTNTTIPSFQSATYFFSNTDSVIYIIIGNTLLKAPQDLSSVTTLFKTPDSLRASTREEVALSPDNNYVAWALSNGQKIGLYLLNLNTLVFKAVKTIPGTNIQYPRFSTDSRKVVYVTSAQVGGFATIETFNIVTSLIDTTLTDANRTGAAGSRLLFPHFSSNNTRLIYMKNSTGLPSDSLITVNLSGEDKQLLDPECLFLGGVVVSRDGSRIVYTKDASLRPLASIKNEGTGFHEITSSIGNSNNNGFSISPNGEKISYWLANMQNLYVLNSDGTDQKVIARGLNGSFSNDQTRLVLTILVDE